MKRFSRDHWIVYGVYWLAALVVTFPLITVFTTHFAGFTHSDAYEMAHHVWWFKYALQHGEPLFEQTLLGYPDGLAGFLLWVDPLQFFPAWLLALILPLPAALNLTTLLYLTLNGFAMYLLMLHLLDGQRIPAALAGLIYMIFPTMQGHLGAGHTGLMMQWILPLYVYALFKLREKPSRRWLWLGALLFIMNAWGHTLQVIYAVLPVTAVFMLTLLARREWAAFRRVIIMSILGAIGLALFLLPVASSVFNTPSYTDEGGTVRYSADLLAPLTPSFFHPVFGNFEYTHRVLGVNIDEGAAYIGIVAALLCILAIWKQPKARWWLLLAIVAYILSLGSLLKILDQPVALNINGNFDTYITLPWSALSSLPLFNLARTPGRFNFVLALAVAAMAGYGLAALWTQEKKSARSWVLLGIGVLLIVFEYQLFWSQPESGLPLPQLPTTTAAIPDEILALQGRTDIRAVLYAPWDNPIAAKEAMYLQTAHQQPLVAGQVTRSTPVSPAKLTLLETFDPALLNNSGVDVVIIHRQHDWDEILQDAAHNQLGEPIFSDDRFALFEVPVPENAPQFTTLPTPAIQIHNRADSYLYAPTAGWGMIDAQLTANGRDAALLLDGEAIQRWQIDGERAIHWPLPLTRGYHTITLQVEPACPQIFNAALRCRALDVSDLSLNEFSPQPIIDPIRFEGGVTLLSRHLPERILSDRRLSVWLWWDFDAPRSENDVRFVHVLNSNGAIAAQDDISLGERATETQQVEVVELSLPDNLPSGRYTVFTGWYTAPQNTRFPVLSDVPGDESDIVFVGEVILP